jgi:CheY-like chemotaxis protein
MAHSAPSAHGRVGSAVAEKCPDVVLMDIRIKGLNDGIQAAVLLRKRFEVNFQSADRG